MPEIKPVSSSKKVAMLVFGNPGVGKTRLAGTGGSNTLIVRPPFDHTDSIRTPGVQEVIVEDWAAMDEVYQELRNGSRGWDWVWLDSISLFQDAGLDDLWETVVQEKPDRARYGLDKAEYGINMGRLGRWVRHMVGLPGFNLGVTAHPIELEDASGDVKLRPYVQGRNMSFKIMGYMNLVAYLEIVKGRRVLRTSPTDNFDAKDQFDAFPKGRLLEPTMPKITKAIEAARPGVSTNRRTKRRRRGGQ